MGSTALLLTAVLMAPPGLPGPVPAHVAGPAAGEIHAPVSISPAGSKAPSVPTPDLPPRKARELFHTALDHTMPADGDTLSAAPDRVELAFTGPIESGETSVSLVLPDGTGRTLEVRTAGDQTPTVSAALPALARGAYRIEWRVLSPDGHPLEGTFVFYVEGPPGDEGASEEGTPTEGAGTAVGGDPGTGGMGGAAADGTSGNAEGDTEETGTATLSVASAGVNLALLGLAGLLGFAAWGPIPPGARTLRAALGLAAAASVLVPAVAWLWTGQALGGDPGLGDRIGALVGLTSGRPILLRLGLSWVALWALAVSRRVRLSAVLAALAVAIGALGGHPASTSPALAQPANAVHLLAAAAWAGGLLYVVTQRSSTRHDEAIHRVSTVALGAVVLVALTGIVQGWLFLESFSALVDTTYGRLVLAKAAGLLVLVGFGAFHRLRLIPAMEENGDSAPLTRAVRVELAVAGVVVVLAAVLAHVSPVAS